MIAIQRSGCAFISLEAQIPRRSASPVQGLRIRLHLLFSSLVSRPKKTEKRLPRPPKKQQKSTPKSTKNGFCEKSIFAILSMRRPRFWSPKRRNSDAEVDKQITWKQARTKQSQGFWIQKLIYTGPKITPKSIETLETTISCPSCCGGPEVPKWPPRVLPRSQFFLLNGNTEPPINGNPEGPQGAGGRGRSP